VNRCLTGLIFLVFVSASLSSAQTLPETLKLSRQEAIEMAISANPQVMAAKEQAEQARARITEAKALPDPTFEMALEEENNFFHPRSSTSEDYGLGFTIPFPSKLHLAGKAAETAFHSAEFNVTLVRNQITQQTAQAYDALLVALKHKQDLEEAKTYAQDFLTKTQARYDAGSVPKLDVIKAKVDLAQSENDLIANEGTIATARAGLNRLLSRPRGAPVEATEVLNVPPPLPDIETLEKLAIVSRPELLSNASDLEGARKSISLAKQFWLPDISLTLSRNYTEGDPAAYSTGASVTLPLLFWQHKNGEVAEAVHRKAELEATAKDVIAQVNLDVQTSYSTASTALRQAVYLRDELLPEAREAFRIASVSYGLGGSSALDLLDAKRTMLDAESQYTDALGAANDSRADLELAVGAPLPAPTGDIHEK
jgi:cobalt-zinc-cadmium efflux system outer membrane protein